MNEETKLNCLIYNLKSVLKEKKRFIKTLKLKANKDGYVDWWLRTVKINNYVATQALETLGLTNQSLSKGNIIELGRITFNSYLRKMEIEEWALEESINLLEKQQSKDVYFKHN